MNCDYCFAWFVLSWRIISIVKWIVRVRTEETCDVNCVGSSELCWVFELIRLLFWIEISREPEPVFRLFCKCEIRASVLVD